MCRGSACKASRYSWILRASQSWSPYHSYVHFDCTVETDAVALVVAAVQITASRSPQHRSDREETNPGLSKVATGASVQPMYQGKEVFSPQVIAAAHEP